MLARPRSVRLASRRSASRMLALGLAAALAAPFALAASPAMALMTSVQVPTPVGGDIQVSADLDGVLMSVHYSELDVAADTYFTAYDMAESPYASIPAPPGESYRVFETGFWATIPEAATVEVCLDFSGIDLGGRVPVLHTPDPDTGDAWQLADPTPGSSGVRACTGYPPSWGSVILLVTIENAPIDPADVDLQVTRVFDLLDIGFGDGPQNGVYLALDATNNGTTPVRLGLGADLRVEGVDEKLWLDSTWGLDAGSGFGDFFAVDIAPGESASLRVPDWPGKTLTFWAVDVLDPTASVVVGTYETGGLFSRVSIDIASGVVEIGSVATFAGTTVFPGVTTTVEAVGLVPGETYDLWLTPGADYLSFMILGGLLAEGALWVGTATVDTTGRLATAFSIPTTTAVGDRYQLMIGDRASRSWPAGTLEPLEIVAPASGATVDGPTPAALEVGITLGAVEVLFTFPAGTTDGQTTASTSTTGPAAVGFSIPGTPPLYLHLSTTAAFTGNVEVCVGVTEGVDPAGLHLYHYALTSTGYAWVDITTRRTVDAVCGDTDSFSPFALGVPEGVRLTSKEQCKGGGWSTSTLPAFRAQGVCIAHFSRMR